jgi:hypothetical protein
MQLMLHLCGPAGEAMRREISHVLAVLKADNRFVISALLEGGDYVPETMWELHTTSPKGCIYRPPDEHESKTPRQDFYCVADLVERGEFSCGDAAAYEAAVLEEIYGIPTEIIVVAQGSTEYHALYVTPDGPVDPTENWIKEWSDENRKPYKPPVRGANRWKRAS